MFAGYCIMNPKYGFSHRVNIYIQKYNFLIEYLHFKFEKQYLLSIFFWFIYYVIAFSIALFKVISNLFQKFDLDPLLMLSRPIISMSIRLSDHSFVHCQWRYMQERIGNTAPGRHVTTCGGATLYQNQYTSKNHTLVISIMIIMRDGYSLYVSEILFYFQIINIYNLIFVFMKYKYYYSI